MASDPSTIKAMADIGAAGRPTSPNSPRTIAATMPTAIPRVIPPIARPASNSPAASGGIRMSTILPCTFETTSDDEVLAKAFCNTVIITRPGTRNVRKSTSPARLARSPTATAKTIMNSIEVMTGAATVCRATLAKRCTSRMYSVHRPTQLTRPICTGRIIGLSGAGYWPGCDTGGREVVMAVKIGRRAKKRNGDLCPMPARQSADRPARRPAHRSARHVDRWPVCALPPG